ncbi:MAG: hypothetical protein H6667_26420 [Ardenticatenaceae bacterium]|nr:hypothetical protein [Ardenticatenaceae bacterium]
MTRIKFFALLAVLLAACQTQQPAPTATAVPPTATNKPILATSTGPATAVLPTATITTESEAVSEQAVQIIPLDGPIAAAQAEISGMTWYGDMLILLPQFPYRFGDQLFTLPKAEIEAFLAGEQTKVTPQPMPLVAPGLSELPGYEGLEAIAFGGDQVFITIETSNGSPMMGYLVAGQIAPDLSQIELDMTNLAEIVPPVPLSNFSDETILVVNDTVLTIYEANGRFVNPSAAAHQFTTGLEPLGTLPFPAIEYRVTDATAVDENGRFWVINYLYPGDIPKLNIAPDEIGERYGRGPTHAASDVVERLVELQVSDNGISLTDTPPIQLKLMPDGEARNWEGIVRLDDRGFLLATDKFPETILAFIAASK